jgi:hypothetical protein
MREYYGTKKIQAEPETRDGKYGYKVVYPDGYVSWSPQEAFHLAYRSSGTMNFGHALMALHDGQKLTREGWSGKGLYILYVPAAEHHSGNGPSFDAYFELFHPGTSPTLNRIAKWVPSVSDVDANDWSVVVS